MSNMRLSFTNTNSKSYALYKVIDASTCKCTCTLSFNCCFLAGRIHHAIGSFPAAINYLHQGLQLAQEYARTEDEAKIRHRLGLALWNHGELEAAQEQLYGAADLFESIRREAQLNNEYKLSMFDLQTASYQVLQVRCCADVM